MEKKLVFLEKYVLNMLVKVIVVIGSASYLANIMDANWNGILIKIIILLLVSTYLALYVIRTVEEMSEYIVENDL